MPRAQQSATRTPAATGVRTGAAQRPPKRNFPQQPPPNITLGPPRLFRENDPKYRSCKIHTRYFTMGVAVVQFVLVAMLVGWLGWKLAQHKREWNDQHRKMFGHDHHNIWQNKNNKFGQEHEKMENGFYFGAWYHNRDHYYFNKSVTSYRFSIGLAMFYLIPLIMLLHGARVRRWWYLTPYLVCHGISLMILTYSIVITTLQSINMDLSIDEWKKIATLTPMFASYGLFAFFVYVYARVANCICYIQDWQQGRELERAMVFVPPPTGEIPRPPSAFGPPPYTERPLVLEDVPAS